MRVVSLVPSWTETLIEAGVDVVGRTRFCIHPKDRVAGIARVGGTKDWDFERIRGLKPDLLVLDREENPKFMSEQSEIPWIATDVRSVEDMPGQLDLLAERTGSEELRRIGERWRAILKISPQPRSKDPPSLLEWGRKPSGAVEQAIYLIWRDPWMAAGRGTFIASVLDRFGWGELVPEMGSKYPKVDLEALDRGRTLLLFSSEPYPFLKKRADLDALGFPYAFVDGENLSWFGVRALRFLERELGSKLC